MNANATRPEIVDRKENEYLGHKLTPYGSFEARWRGGQEVLLDPLEEMTDPGDIVVPPRFKDKHRQAMNSIFFAIEKVSELKRDVPVLREELDRMGVEKQLIKDLEGMGLVKQQMVNLVKLGSRVVVIPTLPGRKLMRFFEEALNDHMLNEAVNETVGPQA